MNCSLLCEVCIPYRVATAQLPPTFSWYATVFCTGNRKAKRKLFVSASLVRMPPERRHQIHFDGGFQHTDAAHNDFVRAAIGKEFATHGCGGIGEVTHAAFFPVSSVRESRCLNAGDRAYKD